MAISNYLNRLVRLKDNLKNILKNKGVDVQDDATLTDLVPLVDEIQGGSDETIEKVLYSFGVLSDVHIRHSDYDSTMTPDGVTDVNDVRDNLQRALTYFKNNGVDFVCTAGDIVWNGAYGRVSSPTDEQKINSCNEWFKEISLYKEYCNTYFDKEVYTITGNHDATTLGHSSGTNLGEIVPASVYGDGTKTALQVWEEVVGNPLNYVIEKGDDVFIFLGMYYWNYINFYRDEDEDWIKEKLELYKDKRVFLFFHVPLGSTTQDKSDGTLDLSDVFLPSDGIPVSRTTGGSSRFVPLTQKYPNVIWFSGHSHYGMDEEEENSEKYPNPNTYQSGDSMTMIHVPSCGFIRKYNHVLDAAGTIGKSTREYGHSQGLVVDVYANKIIVKSIDFSQQEGRSEIQKATYILNK